MIYLVWVGCAVAAGMVAHRRTAPGRAHVDVVVGYVVLGLIFAGAAIVAALLLRNERAGRIS